MPEDDCERIYQVGVRVTLHAAVLDPQGQAILHGLHALGFGAVEQVHAGKFFRLAIRAAGPDAALAEARRACERLLANPVIEEYALAIEDRS
jgi:phosphoribosylformylglycinamidine synthase PurS subunit